MNEMGNHIGIAKAFYIGKILYTQLFNQCSFKHVPF
jgi:hypothetical protein